MALSLAGPAQYVEAEWEDEPTTPADEEREPAVSPAPRIKPLTPPTDSSSDQRRNRLFGPGYIDLLAGDDVGVYEGLIDRSICSVLSSHPDSQLVPTLRQAIRDAMAGHLVKDWPRTLPPFPHAVMAYTTTDPNLELRITIEYEDEAATSGDARIPACQDTWVKSR